MSKKKMESDKIGKHVGSVRPGKKVDNSLDTAPGQKNFALVITPKGRNRKGYKLPSKKEVVMFLPESIKKVVSPSGETGYRVGVIYIDIPISKNGLRTVDLDQLMLGRSNQVRILHQEHPEAGDWYKKMVKELAGKGNLAMTAPTTMAKDGELRQMVHPNELVMYDLDSLTFEEDDNVAFYEIGIYYLRRNALIKVAAELDKLVLTADQLKEVRKKDWKAAKWYANKKKPQSGNSYVKNEFETFEDEE